MKNIFPKYWISAFAGGTITFGIGLEHQLNNSLNAALFNFFGILIAYNYKPFQKSNSNKTAYHLFWFGILSITGILAINYAENWQIWLNLIILGLLSLTYTYKLPFIEKEIRDLPILKIILVVMSWIYACYVLPLYNENREIQFNHLDIFTSVMIILTSISCDYGDLAIDPKHRFTIPQLIGEKTSKIVLIVAFITLFVTNINIDNQLFISICSLINIGIILFIKNNKHLYYSHLIDGSLILWGIGMIEFYINT
jgi:hypothetical protein